MIVHGSVVLLWREFPAKLSRTLLFAEKRVIAFVCGWYMDRFMVGLFCTAMCMYDGGGGFFGDVMLVNKVAVVWLCICEASMPWRCLRLVIRIGEMK